jgi:hypothetical protein
MNIGSENEKNFSQDLKSIRTGRESHEFNEDTDEKEFAGYDEHHRALHGFV